VRGFVAIGLPEGVRAAIRALVEPVARAHPTPRWVRPENLHLTVEFLGAVDEALVERFDGRLRDVAAGMPVAELVLSGVGAFPPGRPRVLWLGLVQGEEWFTTVTRGVRAVIAELGGLPDARPPSAHVTLAREERPDRAALEALRESLADRPFTWRADRLTLYSSVLGRDGPWYSVEREWPFGAGR
jgi:2'-5' RNA ligase